MKCVKMNILVFIGLLISRIFSADIEDRDCEESFWCSPSESCEFYQQQLIQIQNTREVETKKEIFSKLRSLVCNKKSRKVCCPLNEKALENVTEPNVEFERKTEKPYTSCGNPLGQTQHALSGSGRTYSAPWAVSVGYYEDDEYQHECTGSVITKNIVITAAHCTFDNEDDLFIHAGALNLRRLGSTKRKIIQTIEHPDYKPPTVYFDVALAVLEKFLSFDETIFPVCLPTQSYPIQSLSKDGARITMETLEKT